MLSVSFVAWAYEPSNIPSNYLFRLDYLCCRSAFWHFSRKNLHKSLRKKAGYLIVSLGWLLMSFWGALPYIYSGSIPNFTDAFFESVSGFTTTGFVSANYTTWSPSITLLFFLMLFIGGCAGSTSGGIKVIRHLVMAKNCLLEFRRLLHPRAVLPVKISGRVISPTMITNVLVFILLYVVIFAVSSIILASFGLDFETSIGAVATTISNVGAGIGNVGPVDNFAGVPIFGKWFLALLIILGRLELFTVLVILYTLFLEGEVAEPSIILHALASLFLSSAP